MKAIAMNAKAYVLLATIALASPVLAAPPANHAAPPIAPISLPPVAHPAAAPLAKVPAVTPTIVPVIATIVAPKPAKVALPATVIPRTAKAVHVEGLPLTIMQAPKVQMHVLSDPLYSGVVIGTVTGAGTAAMTGTITTTVIGKTATEVIVIGTLPPVTITETLQGSQVSGSGSYTYPGGAALVDTISGTIKTGTITETSIGGGFGTFTGTYTETK